MSTVNIDLNKRAGELIIFEVNKTVGSVEQPSSVQDLGVHGRPKHERFRTTTKNYYRDAHDIITVYDVTDKESFNNVKDWTGEIDKHVSDGIHKLLIENKCDLTSQEELFTDEAKELAAHKDVRYE